MAVSNLSSTPFSMKKPLLSFHSSEIDIEGRFSSAARGVASVLIFEKGFRLCVLPPKKNILFFFYSFLPFLNKKRRKSVIDKYWEKDTVMWRKIFILAKRIYGIEFLFLVYIF